MTKRKMKYILLLLILFGLSSCNLESQRSIIPKISTNTTTTGIIVPKNPDPTPLPSVTYVPLNSTPTLKVYASTTPDSTDQDWQCLYPPTLSINDLDLAYVMKKNENSSIYTIKADGFDKRLLDSKSQDVYQPKWSPGGQKIAYLSQAELPAVGKDPEQVWLLIVQDLSTHQEITISNENVDEFSWSPDGRRIAYIASSHDPNVFNYVMIADIVAGTSINITQDNMFESYGISNISWSPDGESISYQVRMDRKSVSSWIYVMSVNGKEITKIVPPVLSDENPQWYPGKNILFLSKPSYPSKRQIYIMDSSGKNRRQLTFSETDKVGPEWSPDGKKILFESVKDKFKSNLPNNYSLHMMNADGSDDQILISSAIGFTGFAWAPDNQTIAFVEDEKGLIIFNTITKSFTIIDANKDVSDIDWAFNCDS